ncbi:MAG: glycerophosphoryl diester phosphodiesterase [Rhodospirillaceae bacterium]|nr:MAG: glycerophosphoryl diester phosphodiesterase [Rhodospirillaceae bacterium]
MKTSFPVNGGAGVVLPMALKSKEVRAIALPRVIGHRGAAIVAPENTLAAFRAAAGMGVTMIEFDVKLTANGYPVVFHDDTLSRTTNGHGRMRDITLEELERLDAGFWFEPAFAGEQVPTLEVALSFLISVGMSVNIELKPCPETDEQTAQIAVAAAMAYWPRDRLPPLLSSFSRRALRTARAVAPAWPQGLIVDRLPDDWHEAAVALRIVALHCQERHLSPVVVAEVKRAGLAVLAWTVNDPQRAQTLWRWGVDAVITDAPDEILAAVS